MRYLVSQVEQWGAEIDAMPAPDPGRRKVGKKEAIVLLARKLQAAARRGFSTTELHEALSAMGLKVHVDTLRSALKDADQRPAKQPARGRRSPGDPERLRAESSREVKRADARKADGTTADEAKARAATGEPKNGPEVLEGTQAGRPDRLPTLAPGLDVPRTVVSPVIGAEGDKNFTGRKPVAITRVDRSRPGMTQAVRPGPRPTPSDRATFIPRGDSDEL